MASEAAPALRQRQLGLVDQRFDVAGTTVPSLSFPVPEAEEAAPALQQRQLGLVDQRFDVAGTTVPSLSFPVPEAEEPAPPAATVTCPCCAEQFAAAPADQLAAHLLRRHHLVVADLALVADLAAYCAYWAPRLAEPDGLHRFCYTIITNSASTDRAPSERYHLLSPRLDEDRLLRERLQRRRLERALACQAQERAWTQFRRGCLFCRLQYVGRLAGFFAHLADAHHFSVGRPDNIVYAAQFLDAIEEKLEALCCLYCEGQFPDRATLKEHMRKKQHKTINPANTDYDRFYVINYLELGRSWQELQRERDEPPPSGFDVRPEEEDDWSDWREPAGVGAVCLFCTFASVDADRLTTHMADAHGFHFAEIKSRLRLTFYQQVKLVNFIRRQVVERACLLCPQRFESLETLVAHMRKADHLGVPERAVWDQPQYFFPTYENDRLLCALEEADGAADDVAVFAEDLLDVSGSVLASPDVRDELGGQA